jgi:transcriptional regulator with XRE-family HTH domain
MLDMRKIGTYISTLRKQKDMTQVELADMLNVSHQAVSKWERGESMPDIGLLPRLAEIFNKTVDDILNAGEPPENKAQDGNRDTAVAELLQNEPEKVAEMINSGDADIETVIDMVPALTPSVVDGIAQELNGIGIEHLASLAPFLSKDTLDKLVDHVIDKTLDVNHLVEIAPFLRKETLDRLVEQCLVGDLDGKILLELVPFVSRSTLSKLLDRVIEGTLDEKLLEEIARLLTGKSLII